jgi:hypothetical protein
MLQRLNLERFLVDRGVPEFGFDEARRLESDRPHHPIVRINGIFIASAYSRARILLCASLGTARIPAREKAMSLGYVSKCVMAALVAFGMGSGPARCADYRAVPPQVIEGEGPEVVAGYGLDPRCRIIPSPQLTLVGDVYSFQPIAVCQSRGLYADSATIPNSWYPFQHPQ